MPDTHYSSARTAELRKQRLAWKPQDPPTPTDVLFNDAMAQIELADSEIDRHKAHIQRINREEQDE